MSDKSESTAITQHAKKEVIINAGGRPLMFETPEDLCLAISEYFNNTESTEWTVTGLCLAIGTHRDVLIRYGEREGYEDIVSRAKLYVENAYEISLRKNGRTGDIFALKNFGWEDKHTEQTQQLDEHGKPTGPVTGIKVELLGQGDKPDE